MKKIIIEIIGWYGTAAILLPYFLISFSILKADSFIYQVLNLTGAAAIIIISLYKRLYQTAVIDVIWAIIAAIALWTIIF